MRRAAIVVLLLAGCAGGLRYDADQAGGAIRAPSLSVVRAAPLTIAGRRFHPQEKVRVELTLDAGALVRAVHATSTGSFVVSFSDARVEPCDALTVRAVGNRGSSATLRLRPRACISQ